MVLGNRYFMALNKRYVHKCLAVLIFLAMVAAAASLWKGLISVEWLSSFGYTGIFVLSLINSVSPVAGPSQIATFFVASKLNPLWVGVAGGVGGAIGELSGYVFGYAFRASLSEELEHKFERFKNWPFIRISRERSFVALFVLASIPNPFFDPISALAGSLRIGFAKYFVPVLLGRTLRHVVIAYAGFYAISLGLNLPSGTTMTLLVGPIVAVILIAFIAWAVRSYAESDPDPLILNFTFFAFAGQCILTLELLKVIEPVWVFVLLFGALGLVFLQMFTIRRHETVTTEYYKTILEGNQAEGSSSADVERWAGALVRIAGLDFYPQFYSRSGPTFSSGPRGKRRQQAFSVLPENLFKRGQGGITLADLTVPDVSRKWPWRAYVAVCVASWILFLSCILIVRVYK